MIFICGLKIYEIESSVSLILNTSLFGMNLSSLISLRSDISLIRQISKLIYDKRVLRVSATYWVIIKSSRRCSTSSIEVLSFVLNPYD